MIDKTNVGLARFKPFLDQKNNFAVTTWPPHDYCLSTNYNFEVTTWLLSEYYLSTDYNFEVTTWPPHDYCLSTNYNFEVTTWPPHDYLYYLSTDCSIEALSTSLYFL